MKIITYPLAPAPKSSKTYYIVQRKVIKKATEHLKVDYMSDKKIIFVR